jgi:hypothetical protein
MAFLCCRASPALAGVAAASWYLALWPEYAVHWQNGSHTRRYRSIAPQGARRRPESQGSVSPGCQALWPQ